METIQVWQVVLGVVGVPMWIGALIHAARRTDQDFERAGVAPRTFWLITVAVLGPVWAAAYLLYARPRLARASAKPTAS